MKNKLKLAFKIILTVLIISAIVLCIVCIQYKVDKCEHTKWSNFTSKWEFYIRPVVTCSVNIFLSVIFLILLWSNFFVVSKAKIAERIKDSKESNTAKNKEATEKKIAKLQEKLNSLQSKSDEDKNS